MRSEGFTEILDNPRAATMFEENKFRGGGFTQIWCANFIEEWEKVTKPFREMKGRR